MATKKVQVVDKNVGTKIEWHQSGNKLIFGDDDLSIRCDTRQRDWPVHVDICADKDKNLVIGVGVGRYYVAQVDIPATKYEEITPVLNPDEGDTPAPQPLPIDMGEVVLTLWSLDDLIETDDEEEN